MATSFYVDNVLGDDGNDGKAAPWKTLAWASATAHYSGTTPWTINIVDNGWDNPYLENTVANGMIYPDFSGSAGSYVTWNCNFAPMIPATEVTDTLVAAGWARLPGTANVYYVSWTQTHTGVYAWNDDLTDDIMLYNGRHYHMPPLKVLTAIPNDWEDHCYYHNTTVNILYFCDKSGSPADTGVRFAYRGTSSAVFSPSNSVTRSYHKFVNPHFYGGRGTGSIGNCIYQSAMTTTTKTYNQYLRGYLLYEWGSALANFGNCDLVQDCIMVFAPGTTAGYSIRIAGNSGYTDPTQIQNCLVMRSPSGGVFYLESYGRLDIKNTVILDAVKMFTFVDANYTVTESYNFFGLTRDGNITQTSLTGFTPAATDQIVTGDTGYSIAPYYETSLKNLNFRLSKGALTINAGTAIEGRTADMDGNPILVSPDIGPYEFSSDAAVIVTLLGDEG